MRIADDILMHYGVGKLDGAPGRGSGRYPLGSGKNPNQHSRDFLSRIDDLKSQGLTEKQIADAMGLTTTQLRAQKALAKSEVRSAEYERAKELQEQGYNPTEIARIMGYKSESSIRSLLNPKSAENMNKSMVTAELIKKEVDSKGLVDVGTGVDAELGISKEKLDQALAILQEQGYEVYGGRIPQATNPGKYTTLKIIGPPGTEHKDIYNYGEISSLKDYISYDGGESFKKAFEYPASMDSSRLQIRYAEDGGKDKDGVVEIRRGVEDLSLGNSHYAQVRILVDGTHYIKGMAVYSDGSDMPDGVDVIFNTNKSKSVSKMDVLKEIHTEDPDNPFGSLIKEHGGQSYYDDPNGNYIDEVTGNRQSLSLINKRADEGDWGDWADALPSQFLSKQSDKLIKQQLTLAADDKKAEYEEICSLTNPTVKKALLKSFADDCDAAAVHLKAAALPRQKYQVILPLTTIKDTEIYAPNYEDGETVALIRYPHGGTFEIPILKVNNKQAEGREVLGNTPADAVGISSSVAARLSGADFDGDTVMVIPCNSSNSKIKIVSTQPLEGLKNFEPKDEYGADYSTTDADGVTKHYYRNGVEFQQMKNTQTEMGKISNLITDMTLKGATDDELARAVRHSMVVIDAEKHHLDYKASERENNITGLKKKYQAKEDEEKYGGAATLISRAKSQTSVTKRQGVPKINQKGKEWYDSSKPEGALIYKDSEKATYDVAKVSRRSADTNATIRISAKGTAYAQPDDSEKWYPIDGKTTTLKEGDRVDATITSKTRTEKSTKMAETDDAMTLVSEYRSRAELAYADYANQMKSLANQARIEMVSTGKIEYSASAAKTYAEEVKVLKSKLNVSLQNAPKERLAQIIANDKVTAMKQENPDMTKEQIKKASQQALTQARQTVGAERQAIEITDRGWEAIQAGAISENQLAQILDHTDIDKLKERATPRTSTELSQVQQNRIKSLAASGYTTEQIAKALGVSTSTVRKYLKQ
ncbi:MAG: helix-turn-helix domain-containing protein [Lachnospiraceae bacterium]|nr:helix-turn-helix domain-containing protein [Lachnospiraceae bacterium]